MGNLERLGAVASALSLAVTACSPSLPTTPSPNDIDTSGACNEAWAVRDEHQARVVSFNELGIPAFMSGELGCMATTGDTDERAWQFMDALGPVLSAAGTEQMVATAVEHDALGSVHVRFQEYLNGLEIVGAQYVVHATEAGAVRAVGGRFVPDAGLSSSASLGPDDAMGIALSQAGITNGEAASSAKLVYVTGLGIPLTLAWAQHVRWTSENGEELDRVFADANTGALVVRHPQIHRSLNRKVYTTSGSYSLPGSLIINEGGSSGDAVAQAAYVNAGHTYSFYKDNFNRDSFDGNGSTLHSTVHYGSGYNNAYWNGQQMVYGDGDGSQFAPFSTALDVVAHELTHAVTASTADMSYYGESGALNEAWSDIMGASVEAYAQGGTSSATWGIGEDIYTPSVGGDAMRYMADPTADDVSYDYYPERYQGSYDNGGVHINSGIANLAYYLLVNGGSHPRGKTSVSVNGIGIEKAEQIFYRALVYYMTSSTGFEGARNATAQAADDLYGDAEVAAVHRAWSAVGVPGGPSNDPDPGPDPDPDPTVTELANAQVVSGLSGSQGTWKYFVVDVPAGTDQLLVEIGNGSGDADVYVRQGALPTTSSYDARPYLDGNNETATIDAPSVGAWYVGVHAYQTYSGLSLAASWGSGGGSEPPPSSDGVTELESGDSATASAGQGEWEYAKVYVPAGTSVLQVAISGGSGDADLYVRAGEKPTESSWDYRPYRTGNDETVEASAPAEGWWYIGIRGYESYADVTLQVAY